jgi:uncharacterized protein
VDKVELKVRSIIFNQNQSNSFSLTLEELSGRRRLPIVIGYYEAQAIALEIEKMKASRPLTHDLFNEFASNFNFTVNEVLIYKFKEGLFYSMLICSDGTKTVEIDSRTSDAVAIALRFKSPIYTYEQIMNEAAYLHQSDDDDDPVEKLVSEEDELYTYTLAELEDLLDKAIIDEDYEKASQIRDEMNTRLNK